MVVGGGAVGKSALTIQLTQNQFCHEYDPTIEDSYRKHETLYEFEEQHTHKRFFVEPSLQKRNQNSSQDKFPTYKVNPIPIMLDILDTAGQEEYSAMKEQYIRNGEGFLLVYAVSSYESFAEIEIIYRTICKVKDRKNTPIAIIGNKCDVQPNERQVSYQQGLELAMKIAKSHRSDNKISNVLFMETSAKSNNNVASAFLDVVKLIRRDSSDLKKYYSELFSKFEVHPEQGIITTTFEDIERIELEKRESSNNDNSSKTKEQSKGIGNINEKFKYMSKSRSRSVNTSSNNNKNIDPSSNSEDTNRNNNSVNINNANSSNKGKNLNLNIPEKNTVVRKVKSRSSLKNSPTSPNFNIFRRTSGNWFSSPSKSKNGNEPLFETPFKSLDLKTINTTPDQTSPTSKSFSSSNQASRDPETTVNSVPEIKEDKEIKEIKDIKEIRETVETEAKNTIAAVKSLSISHNEMNFITQPRHSIKPKLVSHQPHSSSSSFLKTESRANMESSVIASFDFDTTNLSSYNYYGSNNVWLNARTAIDNSNSDSNSSIVANSKEDSSANANSLNATNSKKQGSVAGPKSINSPHNISKHTSRQRRNSSTSTSNSNASYKSHISHGSNTSNVSTAPTICNDFTESTTVNTNLSVYSKNNSPNADSHPNKAVITSIESKSAYRSFSNYKAQPLSSGTTMNGSDTYYDEDSDDYDIYEFTMDFNPSFGGSNPSISSSQSAPVGSDSKTRGFFLSRKSKSSSYQRRMSRLSFRKHSSFLSLSTTESTGLKDTFGLSTQKQNQNSESPESINESTKTGVSAPALQKATTTTTTTQPQLSKKSKMALYRTFSNKLLDKCDEQDLRNITSRSGSIASMPADIAFSQEKSTQAFDETFSTEKQVSGCKVS